MSEKQSAPKRPRVSVHNDQKSTLVVYVEPTPERFRLAQGEKLDIYGTQDHDFGVTISAHDEGLTIWPETTGADDRFLIDGEPADKRSWSD